GPRRPRRPRSAGSRVPPPATSRCSRYVVNLGEPGRDLPHARSLRGATTARRPTEDPVPRSRSYAVRGAALPLAAVAVLVAGPAAAGTPSGTAAVTPELPSDVVRASFGPHSTWQPEHAVYGSTSTDDVPV